MLDVRMRVGAVAAALVLLGMSAPARAMERVTLTNGFEINCVRREAVGEKVRLYLPAAGAAAGANYMDVAATAVSRVEFVPDPPAPAGRVGVADRVIAAAEPTAAELREMVTTAGAAHHIDAELLASVVHAESGGRARAVSRTGAQGLMQLMPGTAAAVGVHDAFVAAENVEGGTKYFDAMLTRYHNNVELALAAYNAGPGAVDRYRGVPPFRETRAYVARVIREFNRRKMAGLKSSGMALQSSGTLPAQAR